MVPRFRSWASLARFRGQSEEVLQKAKSYDIRKGFCQSCPLSPARPWIAWDGVEWVFQMRWGLDGRGGTGRTGLSGVSADSWKEEERDRDCSSSPLYCGCIWARWTWSFRMADASPFVVFIDGLVDAYPSPIHGKILPSCPPSTPVDSVYGRACPEGRSFSITSRSVPPSPLSSSATDTTFLFTFPFHDTRTPHSGPFSDS